MYIKYSAPQNSLQVIHFSQLLKQRIWSSFEASLWKTAVSFMFNIADEALYVADFMLWLD